MSLNPLRSIVKSWREAEWDHATKDEYIQAYRRFGGSFITHPDVLQTVSDIAKMPLSYLKQESGGELIGAIALWDGCLAGSKNGLKKAGKRDLVDIGNAEIILPISPDHKFIIRHKGNNISSMHCNILNAKISDYELAFVKPHLESSSKFRYNQRKKLRLLEEAGGSYRSIQELSTTEIASHYKALFKKRWQFEAKGHGTIEAMVEKLKPFLLGYVIEMGDKPIAIQLVYMAESPDWLSAEFLNGGVDTDYNDISPGTVVTYLNAQLVESLATEKEKNWRYSFGINDREYKGRLCHPRPVLQL